MERGDNEVGPYQSPMEDGMQHFHEWYRDTHRRHQRASWSRRMPAFPEGRHGGIVVPLDRAQRRHRRDLPQAVRPLHRDAAATGRCCSTTGATSIQATSASDHATPAPEPRLRAEPARAARRDGAAGARELRLRLQPRACGLGAARLRLPGGRSRRASATSSGRTVRSTASRRSCCPSADVDQLFAIAQAGRPAGRPSTWRPAARDAAAASCRFPLHAARAAAADAGRRLDRRDARASRSHRGLRGRGSRASPGWTECWTADAGAVDGAGVLVLREHGGVREVRSAWFNTRRTGVLARLLGMLVMWLFARASGRDAGDAASGDARVAQPGRRDLAGAPGSMRSQVCRWPRR